MKKVLFPLFLTIALVLTAFPISVFAQENNPTLFVNDVSGPAGTQVTVTVSLLNNPGIASIAFDIDYNNSAMTFIRAEQTGLLPNAIYQASPDSSKPLTFAWASAQNSTNSGDLLSLTFLLSENLSENESFPITLTYTSDNIHKISTGTGVENVSFDIHNGLVTIPPEDETTVIYGSDNQAKLGEEFVHSLSIRNNPGFEIITFELNFDPAKLEYIPYGNDTEDFHGSVTKIPSEFYIGIVNETMAADEGKVIALVASVTTFTDDGDIANFRFKIIDDSVDTESINIVIRDFAVHEQRLEGYRLENGSVTLTTASQTLIGLLGDVNGDGVIDALDALKLMRVSVMLEDSNDTIAILGDINKDGSVDGLDSLILMQFSSLLPNADGYGIGEPVYAAASPIN